MARKKNSTHGRNAAYWSQPTTMYCMHADGTIRKYEIASRYLAEIAIALIPQAQMDGNPEFVNVRRAVLKPTTIVMN